jgi:hypothetical protein
MCEPLLPALIHLWTYVACSISIIEPAKCNMRYLSGMLKKLFQLEHEQLVKP